MIIINEKTSIPLWWVFVAIPVLIGGIAWLTTINVSTQSNSADIIEMKKIMLDVQERVIRIEQWQRDKVVTTDDHHSGGVKN